MNFDTETMERRRLRLLEGYLLGLLGFLAFIIVRSVERSLNANAPPLGGVVLAGMVLSLLLCASCVVAYAVLASRIRRDPDLAEALDNELVRSYFSRSWVVAFIATAVTALVFALASSFSPVFRDPLMIALTSIIVGLTAHHVTFYLKVRFS
jgi:hypothetical protein